jgi:Xaa-Pro aminopeptidase
MAFLSQQVFASRRAEMQRFMDKHRLDAVGFLTPDNVFYGTNFLPDVQPWERPIAAIIPRDGAPFLILNELSTTHLAVARERGTIWIDDVTIYSEHPRLRDRRWLISQWSNLLAERLDESGLRDARIGVDSANGLLSRAAAQLGSLAIVPLEREMRELRWVKHPEELDLIRQAAALTDWGQERFRAELRPGRVVQELDFTMSAILADEAARRFNGEHCEIRSFTLSGPDSAAPHGCGAASGKRVEVGHGIVNVLIVRLNGLAVENERTWFCGNPTPEQVRAFEAASAAQTAAIAELRTGNALCNVDTAALDTIERAGYGDRVLHRTGHGIGINNHEFPDDMAFNLRPLRSNEVYSAEPGIYIPGLGGFRHDDTVIVGDQPEVVTVAPKDLASQTVS